MPNFAHLKVQLKCPFCGQANFDLAWFQWGYCIATIPINEYIYHLQDQIRWRDSQDGKTKAWTYFLSRDTMENLGANIGDPKIQDIIIIDECQSEIISKKGCINCGMKSGGIAIRVTDNKLSKAWIFMPDEFDGTTTYYMPLSKEQIVPCSEWQDFPMEVELTN